MYFRTICS